MFEKIWNRTTKKREEKAADWLLFFFFLFFLGSWRRVLWLSVRARLSSDWHRVSVAGYVSSRASIWYMDRRLVPYGLRDRSIWSCGRIRVLNQVDGAPCNRPWERVRDRIEMKSTALDSSRRDLEFDRWLVVWVLTVGEIRWFEVSFEIRIRVSKVMSTAAIVSAHDSASVLWSAIRLWQLVRIVKSFTCIA